MTEWREKNRKHNFIRNIIYIEEIKKLQNTEIKKYRKEQNIDEKLKRRIYQIHSSSYKQATRQDKQIIIIKTINKNINHTNQIIISYISQSLNIII